MTYFMMSEDERMGDTFYKDTMKATWLWPLKSDYDLSRFPAEDDSFSFLRETFSTKASIRKEMSSCTPIRMERNKNLVTELCKSGMLKSERKESADIDLQEGNKRCRRFW